jgi:hypothetical protein
MKRKQFKVKNVIHNFLELLEDTIYHGGGPLPASHKHAVAGLAGL